MARLAEWALHRGWRVVQEGRRVLLRRGRIGQAGSIEIRVGYRLTDRDALRQGLLVRNARVETRSLRGALPGPTGRPGHARAHGFTNDMVADIINNAQQRFVGINENGRRVNVFYRQNNVVITQGDDITRIITAYGDRGHRIRNGRRVPGDPVNVSEWTTNPAYHEVR
jgi:hypothetical protein